MHPWASSFLCSLVPQQLSKIQTSGFFLREEFGDKLPFRERKSRLLQSAALSERRSERRSQLWKGSGSAALKILSERERERRSENSFRAGARAPLSKDRERKVRAPLIYWFIVLSQFGLFCKKKWLFQGSSWKFNVMFLTQYLKNNRKVRTTWF